MAQNTTTVAHAVGAALARAGVDTVFGVLGSGNAVVTNALVDAGATYVAARHEGGATGMADGWARVTGGIGVVSVHQGPGLTNTLTALTEAAKSRTPLLVLAGDTPAAALRSNFRIDQHDLVSSVGAIPERIHSPASAPADALRAWRRAALERRPVVLMLPIDLQAQPAAAADAAPPALVPVPVSPAPRPELVAAAAELLEGAQRPLVIAGRGAATAGAGPALRQLAARCGALLATSAVAHGLFAGEQFALGISGGFATDLAAELMPQADVVLAVGAQLNHWTTRHGVLIGPDTTVIQVDVEADAIGANRPAQLGIVGDAELTAVALAGALGAAGPALHEGWRSDAIRARITAETWHAHPYEDAGTDAYIDPRTFSRAVAERLPEDPIVAIDSGHFQGWPSFYLPVRSARDWVFVNAFQAVGLALGPAIGAAVAQPGRVVVAALGDGGTFLSLAELETAARVSAKLLVLVYDDAAYGAEVHHFAPLGERVDLAQFPDADLAAIARAAGCEAITVRGVDDLAPLADWVAGGSGPLVLDAKVHPGVCAAWLEEAFKAG